MENKIVEISVLLSVYNGEKYVKQSVDSILNQTFSNFEFIIIDDGSTDATHTILSNYNDSRIKIIKNTNNLGLVQSLNLGLSLCKGKYVARMDADDIAYPERLQKQFDFLEDNESVGICGTWYTYFHDEEDLKIKITYPCDDLNLRAMAFLQTPFLHPTVMMRKEILEKHNLKYSPEYYRAEDYALWVELLQFTKGATVPEILLDYRLHQQNETTLANKDPETKYTVIGNIYQKNMELNNINMSTEECLFLAYLIDCAEPFDITSSKNRTQTEHILRKLFPQLKEMGKAESIIKNNIIKTYTYRTIKQHNILEVIKNQYLRNIIFKGFSIYIKRYLNGKHKK